MTWFGIVQIGSVPWQICLLIMTVVTLTALPAYQQTLAAYAFGYSFMYVVYLYLSFRFSGGGKTSDVG